LDCDVPIAVYKLGGSLLRLPDLASRLRHLMRSAGEQRPILLCGGGAVADVVRDWDRLHHLQPEIAHALAMRSLKLNDALLETLLPECQSVASREAAESCWSSGQWPLLDAMDFLESERPLPGDALPRDWNVTSDSIAAWISIYWPAQRLVLLKSCDLPTGVSWTAAAHTQLVDPCFPALANRLPRIDWVNLRSESAAGHSGG